MAIVLTAELVRQILHYDPETGLFTRLKVNPQNSRFLGARAGGIGGQGYRYISIHRKKLSEHSLAWLMSYGTWPAPGKEIDHINGDRTDNRLSNLRLATRLENSRNSRGKRSRKSLFKGVSPSGRRWKAQINMGGRQFYLGTFASQEEAANAYLMAAENHFREFACVRA